MRENYWKLARRRVEHMCKAYNITAELHTGSRANGISYTISFWFGSKHLHELRSLSPMEIFNQLAAFDWGYAVNADDYEREERRMKLTISSGPTSETILVMYSHKGAVVFVREYAPEVKLGDVVRDVRDSLTEIGLSDVTPLFVG